MKKVLSKLFIFSALFPASYLFFMSLVCLFFFGSRIFDKGIFLLYLSAILGVIGYIGFWNLLFNGLSKYRLHSLTFLTLGVIGFLIFTSNAPNPSSFFEVMFEKRKVYEWFLFIYPNLVAIFFIILLSKKLIFDKDRIIE